MTEMRALPTCCSGESGLSPPGRRGWGQGQPCSLGKCHQSPGSRREAVNLLRCAVSLGLNIKVILDK